MRPYRPGDEAALISLWNAALVSDPIDEVDLAARVLADANFDPSGLIVAERARPAPSGPARTVPAMPPPPIVGFALAITRRIPLGPGEGLDPDVGWMTAFGVHPDERRQGIGSALVDAACRELARRGARRVEVSPYAPGYFWPGVDRQAYAAAEAFLKARGFDPRYEAVAMGRGLADYRPPDDARTAEARLEGEGVRFGMLDPSAVVPLIEWNGAVFHADWARAVRDAVARRLPWSRTLLARGPGGEILGFAQFGAYDRHRDRFGPFGVDPSARGRGIGKVLLHRSLGAMCAQGLDRAWFLWTGERSPAGELYRKAGFQVTRRFLLLGRDLVAPA